MIVARGLGRGQGTLVAYGLGRRLLEGVLPVLRSYTLIADPRDWAVARRSRTWAVESMVRTWVVYHRVISWVADRIARLWRTE